MKKLLLSKRVWKIYSVIVSAIAGAESLLFSFFSDISHPKLWAIGNIVAFVLIYVGILIAAKKCRRRTLRVNGNHIEIRFGDLFTIPGSKVIAFNEYFDTTVDEKIISSKTLNGIVLNKHIDDIEAFNVSLENDKICVQSILENNVGRLSGKTVKYALGTCFKYDQFIAVAFTHFDDRDVAFITMPEYLSCLTNMWTNLNSIYAGDNLVLPLLGSGITRMKAGAHLDKQEQLNILISTLRYSNVEFSHDSIITIVLPENLSDEINIFTLDT